MMHELFWLTWSMHMAITLQPAAGHEPGASGNLAAVHTPFSAAGQSAYWSWADVPHVPNGPM